MTGLGEHQWVYLIAMLGWLALVAGAYRSHQIDTAKTLRLALTWAAIFAGVAILFGMVM